MFALLVNIEMATCRARGYYGRLVVVTMAKVPQWCMHVKHVLWLESIFISSFLFEPGVSLAVHMYGFHVSTGGCQKRRMKEQEQGEL